MNHEMTAWSRKGVEIAPKANNYIAFCLFVCVCACLSTLKQDLLHALRETRRRHPEHGPPWRKERARSQKCKPGVLRSRLRCQQRSQKSASKIVEPIHDRLSVMRLNALVECTIITAQTPHSDRRDQKTYQFDEQVGVNIA